MFLEKILNLPEDKDSVAVTNGVMDPFRTNIKVLYNVFIGKVCDRQH